MVRFFRENADEADLAQQVSQLVRLNVLLKAYVDGLQQEKFQLQSKVINLQERQAESEELVQSTLEQMELLNVKLRDHKELIRLKDREYETLVKTICNIRPIQNGFINNLLSFCGYVINLMTGFLFR